MKTMHEQIHKQGKYAIKYFTKLSPSFKFNLIAFEVHPPICPVTYSCEVISGPRTDICSVDDGGTQASFHPSTGNYEFESIDMLNYPPGVYDFKVTGTVGTKSDFIIFTMELVDPCLTATLSLQASPFSDNTYVLRDPSQ